MVALSKFLTDNSHILGIYVKNLLTTASWCLGFVHPWAENRCIQISQTCFTIMSLITEIITHTYM